MGKQQSTVVAGKITGEVLTLCQLQTTYIQKALVAVERTKVTSESIDELFDNVKVLLGLVLDLDRALLREEK